MLIMAPVGELRAQEVTVTRQLTLEQRRCLSPSFAALDRDCQGRRGFTVTETTSVRRVRPPRPNYAQALPIYQPPPATAIYRPQPQALQIAPVARIIRINAGRS
jgi:hypothetical protein